MKYLSKNKLYYLASPYSHVNEKNTLWNKLKAKITRYRRFKAVTDAAVHLIKQGYTCIEPIAMCHYKSVKYDLPTGYSFWQKRDRWFIRKCEGIVVLTLKGWKESEGVSDEVKFARAKGLDVIYLDPNSYTTMAENKRKSRKVKLSIIGGKDAVHKTDR